jgi:extradiol dioxygenase family protein
MARATAFYCEVLGCEVTYGDDYWTSLDAYGLKIGLHWTEGESIPPILHDDHGAFVGATITFSSDNILQDKERLQRRHNVEIIGELDEAFGHLLVFKDSEGNILKLMHQKYL